MDVFKGHWYRHHQILVEVMLSFLGIQQRYIRCGICTNNLRLCLCKDIILWVWTLNLTSCNITENYKTCNANLDNS